MKSSISLKVKMISFLIVGMTASSIASANPFTYNCGWRAENKDGQTVKFSGRDIAVELSEESTETAAAAAQEICTNHMLDSEKDLMASGGIPSLTRANLRVSE